MSLVVGLGLPSPSFASRWEVVERLRRDLGAGSLRARVGLPGVAAAFPPINIYEGPQELVVTAALPGVRLEDLELTYQNDRLTLRGERKIEFPQDAKLRLQRSERRAGRFERVIALPPDLDGAKIEAAYRNGILVVKLPRTPAQTPRRIPVQADAAGAAAPIEEETR